MAARDPGVHPFETSTPAGPATIVRPGGSSALFQCERGAEVGPKRWPRAVERGAGGRARAVGRVAEKTRVEATRVARRASPSCGGRVAPDHGRRPEPLVA